MTFQKALFVFRRDLRIEDNTGLIYALENAREVICAFIFTPEQITNNSFRSESCLQFMLESLHDLERSISNRGGQLFYFFDTPEKVISKCIIELNVDLVVVNCDYTPYSIERDKRIKKACKDIAFKSFDDALLHVPEDLLNKSGKPYKIFTPFYKNAIKLSVLQPRVNQHTNYSKKPIYFSKSSSIFNEILPKRAKVQKGGRNEALKILKKLSQFSLYEKERNYPAIDGTTHLSPHLKFTTVSPREVYHSICKVFNAESELARALYWRDFFSSIATYFPYVFEGAFYKKYDKLPWQESPSLFKSWTEGKTGFPIVDAGMRELNQTGYMHNRVRMIAASFLVKDLHIDWRLGEKYFAQHLIDYDPAVNNGNWQWVASTGCDAQPYFRIFNPWSQQVKFDPDCKYIKKWIPELAKIDPKTIHNWYKEEETSVYPLPIVNHNTESKETLTLYKKC